MTTRTHHGAPALTLALAFILGGCGGSTPATDATSTPSSSAATASTASESPTSASTATPATDLSDDWRRITLAEKGFSLAVPVDWIDMSLANLSGGMDAVVGANPQVAKIWTETRSAIESGKIALFAFDDRPEVANAAFRSNVNVISPTGALPGNDTEALARQLAAEIKGQLPVIGEVQPDTTVVPAGKAAVIRYQWNLTLPGGGETLISVTQYLVVGERRPFIVSLTSTAEQADEYEPIFQQIIGSLREE
jgi:hypothetical protein